MTLITPEQADELRRLYAELEQSYVQGAALLRTGGKPLEGRQLALLLDEEQRQARLVRRIKEIQGD